MFIAIPDWIRRGEDDGLTRWPVVDRLANVVVVDLSYQADLTTTDFAQLVMLRRRLLDQGRDLHVTGLRGKARRIYEISRLHAALPEAA